MEGDGISVKNSEVFNIKALFSSDFSWRFLEVSLFNSATSFQFEFPKMLFTLYTLL